MRQKVKIKINNIIYESISTAAKAINVSNQTIINRIKANKMINGYFCEYVDETKQKEIIDANNNSFLPVIRELHLPNDILTARINKTFKNEKIYSLADLTQQSERDLLKSPDFGKKCMQRIIEALERKGLSLDRTEVTALDTSIHTVHELKKYLNVRIIHGLICNGYLKISDAKKVFKEGTLASHYHPETAQQVRQAIKQWEEDNYVK